MVGVGVVIGRVGRFCVVGVVWLWLGLYGCWLGFRNLVIVVFGVGLVGCVCVI